MNVLEFIGLSRPKDPVKVYEAALLEFAKDVHTWGGFKPGQQLYFDKHWGCWRDAEAAYAALGFRTIRLEKVHFSCENGNPGYCLNGIIPEGMLGQPRDEGEAPVYHARAYEEARRNGRSTKRAVITDSAVPEPNSARPHKLPDVA